MNESIFSSHATLLSILDYVFSNKLFLISTGLYESYFGEYLFGTCIAIRNITAFWILTSYVVDNCIKRLLFNMCQNKLWLNYYMSCVNYSRNGFPAHSPIHYS